MTPRKDGFLCYAHAGGDSPSRRFVLELQEHLGSIYPEQQHAAWCDQDIESGADWLTTIHQALERAAYAVLFVNIEFLRSRFIADIELPELLKAANHNGLLLVPLRVSYCLLPDWLELIQFLNADEKPLASMRRVNRDRVYTAVAKRVRDHLSSDTGGYLPNFRKVRVSPPTSTKSRSGVGLPATSPITDPIAPRETYELRSALSEAVAAQLEQIRRRHRQGERGQVGQEIAQLLEHPHWSVLNAELRGRILRTAALYCLLDGSDVDDARALAERALAEDPYGDGQVIAAQIAYRTEGATSALALLAEPGSAVARQVKAGILLESGQPEAALALLTDPAQETEPDGGNFRLRALALVSLRRIPEAAEAIDQASALELDAFALQTTAALVDFWRACTPAALDLTDQPLAPTPFPRAFVRSDDGAQAALKRAAERLDSVLKQIAEGTAEWRHWATWRLICLLASGESAGEAAELTGRILDNVGPLPLWALLWAMPYGIPFDRPAVTSRLHATPPADPDFIAHRGIYYELCLADGDAASVLEDLPAVRGSFEDAGELDVWRQWQTLALATSARYDEARSAAEEIEDEKLKLRLQLHIARSEPPDVSANRRLAAADALLNAAADPHVLLEACNIHAAEGDWDFIARHAEQLISVVPTPGSLRLLIGAAWNRGDYRGCLTSLDDHRHIFPGATLPPDLAMLRVRCQRALGEVSGAAAFAREMFERNPTPQALQELFNAQLQGGDEAGVQQSLRRMLSLEGMPGDDLLRAAVIADQRDHELATSLWRKATEVGSDAPDFAIRAAMTGTALGLGDETAPWFRQMTELAQSGVEGIKAIHISEMPDLIRSQWEDIARIQGLYRRGEISIHALPESFRSLSELLHRIPEANRSDPDPLRQQPVWIRHGARPPQRSKPGTRPQGRLILDITALLTAHDLDLLDRIEARLAPLYVTPNWYLILRDEIRQLRPIQPERLAAQQRIAALVRAGGIGVVDLEAQMPPPVDLVELVGERHARELAYCRAVGACLVDLLPLRGPDLAKWEPVELPDEWNTLVAGPRALLDLALAEDLIDANAHADACSLFGSQPLDHSKLPGHGGQLLVSLEILELFAQADLLPALAYRFRFTMPADQWHQTESQLHEWEENEHLARWVQGLIERIAAGLKTGTYRILETARPPNDPSQSLRGLEDVLEYRGEPGDMIWIDDRLLNSYTVNGICQIVGVLEILGFLEASSGITKTQRYDWLARLRAGNHRYIPLEKGEILHWLKQAHSHGERLLTPSQLEILARHWSACLFESDALQLNPTERLPHGEIGFVAASRSAIDHALLAIWADRRLNNKRKRQRADWILDHLYVGLEGTPHMIRSEDPDRNINLPGSEIGLLVLNAYALVAKGPPKRETDKAPAERYLEWICERVITPRLAADPQVVRPAAAAIRQSVADLLDDHPEPEYAEIAGHWTLRFLRIVPHVLRTELHKDQALMERLGLAELEVIEVRGLRFATTALWTAVDGALRGGILIINEIDDNKPLTLRLISAPGAARPELELADAKGKVLSRGPFKYSGILSPTRDVRLQALRDHPQWWDGHLGDCEAVERMLAAIDNPHGRVRGLETLMTASADAFYADLELRLRQPGTVRYADILPPAIDAMLSYARCIEVLDCGTVAPTRCWDWLSRTVPAERGLLERLRRITLLPVPLPEEAHAEIQALGAPAAEELLDRLQRILVDPIGRLHLLDIALSVAQSVPDAITTVQSQVDYLTTADFEGDVRFLLALIDMAYRALDGVATDTDIHAEHRPRALLLAAWIHGVRLSGMLLARGVDGTKAREHLQEWVSLPYRDLYAAASPPHQDLAWPWHVHASELIFVGLGAILARHPEMAARLDLTVVKRRLNDLLNGQPDPGGDLHLLRNPYLLTDLLGCLWDGDRASALATLVEPEAVAGFAPGAFRSHISGLLAELAQSPTDLSRWMLLWQHVRHARLEPGQADQLDTILSGLDLDEAFQRDPQILPPVMDLAVRNASDRHRIERWINRWAEGIDSGTYPGPGFVAAFATGAEEEFIGRLVDWVHSLAIRHPEDPDHELARLLDGLALRSRTIAARLRPALTALVRRLPFARHRMLHRSLLCARSRPEPVRDPDDAATDDRTDGLAKAVTSGAKRD